MKAGRECCPCEYLVEVYSRLKENKIKSHKIGTTKRKIADEVREVGED